MKRQFYVTWCEDSFDLRLYLAFPVFILKFTPSASFVTFPVFDPFFITMILFTCLTLGSSCWSVCPLHEFTKFLTFFFFFKLLYELLELVWFFFCVGILPCSSACLYSPWVNCFLLLIAVTPVLNSQMFYLKESKSLQLKHPVDLICYTRTMHSFYWASLGQIGKKYVLLI